MGKWTSVDEKVEMNHHIELVDGIGNDVFSVVRDQIQRPDREIVALIRSSLRKESNVWM